MNSYIINSELYSSSADKTAIKWDLHANTIGRRFRDHTGIINCCHPARRGPPLLSTASDDCTARVIIFLNFSLTFNY